MGEIILQINVDAVALGIPAIEIMRIELATVARGLANIPARKGPNPDGPVIAFLMNFGS
jgi:hypothetical protein